MSQIIKIAFCIFSISLVTSGAYYIEYQDVSSEYGHTESSEHRADIGNVTSSEEKSKEPSASSEDVQHSSSEYFDKSQESSERRPLFPEQYEQVDNGAERVEETSTRASEESSERRLINDIIQHLNQQTTKRPKSIQTYDEEESFPNPETNETASILWGRIMTERRALCGNDAVCLNHLMFRKYLQLLEQRMKTCQELDVYEDTYRRQIIDACEAFQKKYLEIVSVCIGWKPSGEFTLDCHQLKIEKPYDMTEDVMELTLEILDKLTLLYIENYESFAEDSVIFVLRRRWLNSLVINDAM